MDTIFIDTSDYNSYGEINLDIYTNTTDSFRFRSALPIRYMSAADTFFNVANKHHFYNIKLKGDKFIDISLSGGRDTITYTAPELDSAIVYAANPDSLELFFDRAVTITSAGWDIDSSGGSPTITIASVGGNNTSSPYFLLNDSLNGEVS